AQLRPAGRTCPRRAIPRRRRCCSSTRAWSSTSSAGSSRNDGCARFRGGSAHQTGIGLRALIQRVREARVTVANRIAGEIGPGVLVLAAVAADDADADREWLAR